MSPKESEKLRYPPIKEAIIIINLRDQISLEKLKTFSESPQIKTRFPIRKSSIQHRFTIDRRKESSSSAFQNLQDGFILQTTEKEPVYILQSKRKTISLHKVGSYSTWEDLIAELKIVLDCFKQVIGGEIMINNIGVRYINHIPISLNQPLEDYFKLLPGYVEGVPTNLNKFFLQLGVEEKDLNGIIIESIIPNESEIRFVIDLRVTKGVKDIELSNEEVWLLLNEVRSFKNQLFFSIITDKTKALFNELPH